MRRLRLLLPIVGLIAVALLTGCRTAPAVAAYVGDQTISTEELAAAVDERMADDNIAAVVEPGDAQYQRVVLEQLVQQEIYRLLAANYDVTVSESRIDDKVVELLTASGSTIEEQYARTATDRMLAAVDVWEIARQLLIREEVADAEGLADPLQESALRQRYEEVKSQLSTIELGLITVPDQATADSVLAAVVAEPSSYPDLAATYAGPTTAPEFVSGSVSSLPPELLTKVLETAVGQGFTVVAPTGGVLVSYVASLDVPSYEDARDQVRAEAASRVDAAALEVVTAFVADLDIDVNPRFGSFDKAELTIVPTGGGAVQILGDTGTP